jgi:hypothetical protein
MPARGRLARCIDDAYVKAQNLSGVEEIEEAARVCARARQLLADMGPTVAALLDGPGFGRACGGPRPIAAGYLICQQTVEYPVAAVRHR